MLAFASWTTIISCNAPGLVLYIGIGDRKKKKENKNIVTIVFTIVTMMMIIDSYQRLKDPYTPPASVILHNN